MERLGLIAGGGGLPLEIARACARKGRPLFVVRLRGSAEPGLEAFEGVEAGLAEFGRTVKALKAAGCRRVCFAGKVAKPDFAALRPDLLALKHLPAVVAAARAGDDALLRAVLGAFEKEGLEVEGVDEAAADLILRPGPLGAVAPAASDEDDIRLAMQAALEVGRSDVGQGAVVRTGAVVATETEDGTDAMLARCAKRWAGSGAPRSGVLAKAPKPGQDLRVDLPTIGRSTVENAAAAGLKGIVGLAGALLVVDREAVRETADRLGLFVAGVEAPESAA